MSIANCLAFFKFRKTSKVSGSFMLLGLPFSSIFEQFFRTIILKQSTEIFKILLYIFFLPIAIVTNARHRLRGLFFFFLLSKYYDINKTLTS